MRVSVLIPFRGDGAERDRLWNHIRPLWEALPVELVVGEDPGDTPFNVSRAFNDAAGRASGDLLILASADALPPPLTHIEHLAQQLAAHPWAGVYAETGAYSATDTDAILAGADPDDFRFDQWAPFCTGALAMHRITWDDVNGMDERFYGWGCEDTALRLTLETLHGMPPTPAGTARALHHPPASRDRFNANAAHLGAYQAAAATSEDSLRRLIAGNR